MNPPKIDAFVLAAGKGMRARPLSLVKPKPLFPLGGVPLIRLLLEQLRGPGTARVFVNLHYRGSDIRRSLRDVDGVEFLGEETLSGSRILAFPRGVDPRPLLVVNGDVFMDIPVEAILREYRRVSCDGVLLVRRRTDASYKAVIEESGWFRGTRRSSGNHEIMYCGAGLFSPRMLAAIRHDSFFTSLEGSSLRVRLVEYSGIWLDLGTPALYHRACFDFLERAGLPESAACSPSARIDGSVRLKRTILWDNVTLGPDTSLDHVILADGVRLHGGSSRCRVITRDSNVPLGIA